MSIRPVDFNGMIQNTNNVQQMKSADDAQATLQQSNMMVQGEQREEHKNSSVQSRDDASKEQFNPEEGGDGTGWQGNRNGKKKGENGERKKDGIYKKMPYSSIDYRV